MNFKLLRNSAPALYFLIFFLISVACCIKTEALACGDHEKGVVVVDAGHGGVDGGANRNGILEKDINLKLALKIKTLLEVRGFDVILTRDRDISLDHLNKASSSRHLRDLIARVEMINTSEARVFLSIHVNCNVNNPAENGSIVFYSSQSQESKSLAASIQNELNKVPLEGMSREAHAPSPGRYYILGYTKIPGVIIESAFLSNTAERESLTTEEFLDQLAAAVAAGTEQFLTANKAPAESGNHSIF